MALAELALLVLIAGTVLLPTARAQATSAIGVVATSLAVAGVRAAATPDSPGFRAVTGALMLAAVAVVMVAAWRSSRGPKAWFPGSALTVAGALGLLLAYRAQVLGAPPGPLLAALGGVLALGLLLFGIGRIVRFAGDGRLQAAPSRGAIAGLLAGIAAAAVGPTLGVVVVGVIAAAWSSHLAGRGLGNSRLPLAPTLTLPLLGAWWLMAIIAGAQGLGIAGLPEVPLSPAAERLLAPVFLLAAWAVMGLWPLHRQMIGAFAAPAGALLLARVATPATPEGLDHWRALAMPVGLLGLWHAGLSGRRSGVAVGLAWIGLVAGSRWGELGAALLLCSAVMLELLQRRGGTRGGRVVPTAAALLGGYGGLLVVEAGLRAEVVYTVLGGAAVVAAAGFASREAMMASTRSTTEPSA